MWTEPQLISSQPLLKYRSKVHFSLYISLITPVDNNILPEDDQIVVFGCGYGEIGQMQRFLVDRDHLSAKIPLNNPQFEHNSDTIFILPPPPRPPTGIGDGGDGDGLSYHYHSDDIDQNGLKMDQSDHKMGQNDLD